MLPGNGGIPFRTTDLGFCSDSSEVIFTFSLLAPVSHHHRLALPFCGKVTLFVNAFLIYRYYISHFLRCQAGCYDLLRKLFFLAFPTFISYNYFKTDMCTDLTGRGSDSMENTQNTPKRSGGKISYTLQAIGLIPLLALGIMMLFFTSQWFTKTMYQEVERELYDATKSATTLLNAAYPGDYRLEGDVAYLLYKGDVDITREYSLFDQFKEDTGLDITLFYQDTRILTTLYNAQGDRIVGSGAPDVVIRDVLNTGEDHFYINTLINGKTYFSYYSPVRNQDGSIVGMLFIGKSSAAVSQSIQRYVYPLTWLIIGFVALVAVCIYFYTRRFVAVLLHIHSFLSEVASGNLNATLDHSVTKRSDELGDIGRCALSMQRSLRTMIEQDALTELYNRRSGEKKLRQIFEEAQSSRHSFALAIGDIDFFKKVNDTYGHECGDAVLKNVSALLKQHMWRRGFAARWGGEEFLLVFENVDLAEARKQLDLLMDKIHELDTLYEGQHVKINMTFGLVCESDKDVHTLLKEADEKLYIGKTNGRNQVIS